MRVRSLLLVLLLAFIASAQQKPPVAPVRPVTDDYYGTKITDPYRWMENTKDPQFQSWAKAQATYTEEVLKSVPGREKLLETGASVSDHVEPQESEPARQLIQGSVGGEARGFAHGVETVRPGARGGKGVQAGRTPAEGPQ